MALLAISYLLNVADYIFTRQWIHLYGIEAEANPLGRWMMQNGTGGFIKIGVMAGLFFLLGILIKRRPKARVAIYMIFSCYCLVIACHLTFAFFLFT